MRSDLIEALVAVWTLVALLCIVRLQVSHLGRGVGEGLVAVGALVRLLAAVHQLVALQVAGGGEELAAHPAGVARLARVPLAMEVEQADLPVALPAGQAAVRLQGAVEATRSVSTENERPTWCRLNQNYLPVCFLVGLAGRWVRKGLVAVPTAEWLLSGVNAHVSLEITSVCKFLPTFLQGGGSS